MVKGAIHPNGSNFRRVVRLDIVDRMRRLVNQNLYDRPRWLTTCEHTPPLESKNFEIQDKLVRNPYPQMVRHVLKKHPDLRFVDCFVDGNDWSAGNDTYRPDHPVMKFVARQKHIMNTEGLSKRDAFAKTEKEFAEKRMEREKYQKIRMALMQEMFGENNVKPLFTTGSAIHTQATAELELQRLRTIKNKLIKEREKLPENREGVKLRGKLPEHIRAKLQRKVAYNVQGHRSLVEPVVEVKKVYEKPVESKKVVEKVVAPAQPSQETSSTEEVSSSAASTSETEAATTSPIATNILDDQEVAESRSSSPRRTGGTKTKNIRTRMQEKNKEDT